MKRLALVGISAVLLTLLSAPGAWAFGWKDVRDMHLAGVSDSLIIDKIHYSGKVFSLEPNQIVDLKKAGVSDAVIQAMLRTEGDEDQGEGGDDNHAYYHDPHYSDTHIHVGLGFGFGYYDPYYYPYPAYSYYPYYYPYSYPYYRSYAYYGYPRYRPYGHQSYGTTRYRSYTYGGTRYSAPQSRYRGAAPYQGGAGYRGSGGYSGGGRSRHR